MYAMVIDSIGDKIYFTFGNIEMMNTDGSGRTTIIPNPGLQTKSLGLDLNMRYSVSFQL